MKSAQSSTGKAVAGVGLLASLAFINPNNIRSLPATNFSLYLHYSTSAAAWFSTSSIYSGYVAGVGPRTCVEPPIEPSPGRACAA